MRNNQDVMKLRNLFDSTWYTFLHSLTIVILLPILPNICLIWLFNVILFSTMTPRSLTSLIKKYLTSGSNKKKSIQSPFLRGMNIAGFCYFGTRRRDWSKNLSNSSNVWGGASQHHELLLRNLIGLFITCDKEKIYHEKK